MRASSPGVVTPAEVVMNSKFVGGVLAALGAALFSAYGLAAASHAQGGMAGRAVIALALAGGLLWASFLLLRVQDPEP